MLILLIACRPSPPANPAFDEAAGFSLQSFEDKDPVNLAFAVRAIEAELLSDIDLEGSLLDRSRRPLEMEQATAESFPVTPDRQASACLPVSVAHLSEHPLADHIQVQLLADQTPIEPASKDKYDRIILEGEGCFEERSCELLVTENQLIKDNVSMTLDYTLWKDLRWVDLGLPDPADVPEGELAVAEQSRWALVGRSWISEPALDTTGGASIMQSYSLEVWVPQESGTLRMMALWSETIFDGNDPGEDAVLGTTRYGIQGIFDAADEWIEDSE